jgi:hypothetical protein
MPTFGRCLCAASRVYAVTQITLRRLPLASLYKPPMRDHAHTLSDFRVPTLSIECAHAAGSGATNVARLIERSLSDYDQCMIRYGEDSRLP